MTAITTTDLENAKLDVDHIAAIATSTDETATDRLDQEKLTLAGAIALISGTLGIVGKATKADLDADLVWREGTVGWVLNDSTAANNAVYRKTGPKGSGAWAAASDSLLSSLMTAVSDLSSAVLLRQGAPGYALSLIDALGRVGAGLRTDGTLVSTGVDIGLEGAVLRPSTALPGHAVALLDALGRASFAVRDDGTLRAGAVEVETLNGAPVSQFMSRGAGRYVAEVVHIATYGQSLSAGADTAISTTAAYDSIGLNDAQTAFIPLVEPAEPIATGESPSYGTAFAIKRLIEIEEGLTPARQSYRVLVTCNGVPSLSIAQLSKGTSPYTALLASVQAAYDIAQAQGKSYRFLAITWTQGEANYGLGTTRSAYKTALLQLLADIDADVKAITGQTDDVQLICYQLQSHKFYSLSYPTIALALLDAARESPRVHLATPMYMFDYIDPVHADATSTLRFGMHYGLVTKRVCIDQATWRPLAPVSKYRQGKVAVVRFDVPVGPLQFDTDAVAANTAMGFRLYDAGGSEITITSVAIIGPDTVQIVAASSIPSGAKLQYAFTGSGSIGRTTGPRGNLRDSQAITFSPPIGAPYTCHNWCVMFEEIF